MTTINKNMEIEEIKSSLLSGLDCAQTVITCFANDLELDESVSQRLTSAFGGGMYCGDTCGAVIGSLMVLGMKYGFQKPVILSDKNEIRNKALEFRRRFIERRGSCICRDLLGADLGTPEGNSIIQQKNLLAELCPLIIYDAIDILEEMFDEE